MDGQRYRSPGATRAEGDGGDGAARIPGKRSLAAEVVGEVAVQRRVAIERPGAGGGEAGEGAERAGIHAAARAGTSGPSGALPYLDLIQRSFGRHDVGDIRAHTGPEAVRGAQAMGAEGFAVGDQVAFAGAPSLHTAAHEAAHVVQQRSGLKLAGGVGQEGDLHERHADAVADRVVRGESAEALLDAYAGARTEATVGPGAAWMDVQQKITITQANRTYDTAESLWKEGGVRAFLESKGWSTRGRRAAINALFDAGDRTYGTVAELVDELRGIAPVKRELGRGRPEWNEFWEALHPGYGNDRRHIVLSSLMRNALYNVTDSNQAAAVVKVYSKLLNEQFDEAHLADAEKKLASKMHNNKFNIFFGPRGWNSMIGGVAHKLGESAYAAECQKLQGALASEARAAQALPAVAGLMRGWFDALTKASVFGKVREHAHFLAVTANRIQVVCREAQGQADAILKLAVLLEEFHQIREDAYKSSSDDPSQSTNDDYRKLQNQLLLQYHDLFMAVTVAKGDTALSMFAGVYMSFMDLEALATDDKLKQQIKLQKQDTAKNEPLPADGSATVLNATAWLAALAGAAGPAAAAAPAGAPAAAAAGLPAAPAAAGAGAGAGAAAAAAGGGGGRYRMVTVAHFAAQPPQAPQAAQPAAAAQPPPSGPSPMVDDS